MKIVVLPPWTVTPTFWAIVTEPQQVWCSTELAERVIGLLPDADVLRLPGGAGSAAGFLAARGLLPSEATGADLDELAALFGVQR